MTWESTFIFPVCLSGWSILVPLHYSATFVCGSVFFTLRFCSTSVNLEKQHLTENCINANLRSNRGFSASAACLIYCSAVFTWQAVSHQLNAMTEDMYTNGSATPGSPVHAKGQEVRKVRLIQFEKVTEEPMVIPCHILIHCLLSTPWVTGLQEEAASSHIVSSSPSRAPPQRPSGLF